MRNLQPERFGLLGIIGGQFALAAHDQIGAEQLAGLQIKRNAQAVDEESDRRQ